MVGCDNVSDGAALTAVVYTSAVVSSDQPAGGTCSTHEDSSWLTTALQLASSGGAVGREHARRPKYGQQLAHVAHKEAAASR
jgi:hypothetical protein